MSGSSSFRNSGVNIIYSGREIYSESNSVSWSNNSGESFSIVFIIFDLGGISILIRNGFDFSLWFVIFKDFSGCGVVLLQWTDVYPVYLYK